jgi:hypothetical protein
MKDDFPSRWPGPKLRVAFRGRMLSPSRTRCQAGRESAAKAPVHFKEILAIEDARAHRENLMKRLVSIDEI